MSEPKRIQSYENDQIRVQYNPNICEHAAECVKGAPDVFNPKERKWINLEGADPNKVEEVIKRCPTGALTFEMKGDGKNANTAQVEGATEIDLVPNGPLRLKGNLVIRDAEGEVILEASKASLCRCGASKNKPFCDGTHKSIDFKA